MATAKQILAMDEKQWLQLSEQEMRKATKILVDVAAKRVKRLEAAKEKIGSSPALAKVDRGGKFTTKGKNLEQLRQEFMRVKSFLTSETSTVSGFKKVQKQIIKQLEKHGIKMSEKNSLKFWNIYRKYSEIDARVNAGNDFKYTIMREIAEYIDDGQTEEDILKNMGDKYDAEYERQQEETAVDFSNSQFFE